MKYFLDTEFHEYKKGVMTGSMDKPEAALVDTIELISIGIVPEIGQGYYSVCKDFDVEAAWNNEWLRENVLEDIFKELKLKHACLTNCSEANTGYRLFSCANLTGLIGLYGKTKAYIAAEVVEFVGNRPYNTTTDEENTFKQSKVEFYGYYADYDWVILCWCFGRMIDLPEGFPMYCIDLKQMLNDIGNPDISFLRPDNAHNALEDAKYHKSIYDFVELNNSMVEAIDKMK
jgi:hypothetical protein